ncbi:Cys-tRNA(Pro) deacylase [Amnibacterium flavum]|uniref:Cys-tRNA(Pro)/Cys-tRNA(Cys) deacylase n=1 Tax=Amnibacterium flavum TaxID=2173173 RepID=A0A2V1HW90_9MICO|nr:Cys-tRNA(Pro) deacylase [Amnibacterium flavum]PVZ94717.1 Cys-tRNA(Pro) deacylase [Amnibacterium flavum]
MSGARRTDKARTAATLATALLTSRGVRFETHSYEHDPAAPSYGLEAAEAMAVSPDRVFKTLVASVDARLVVGVVPVSATLDLKALAHAVGGKRAEMADQREAERKTGYLAGGISPVGQKTALTTVLDESVELHDTVFVSGGLRGFEIELAPADLAEVTGATLASIARAERSR